MTNSAPRLIRSQLICALAGTLCGIASGVAIRFAIPALAKMFSSWEAYTAIAISSGLVVAMFYRTIARRVGMEMVLPAIAIVYANVVIFLGLFGILGALQERNNSPWTTIISTYFYGGFASITMFPVLAILALISHLIVQRVAWAAGVPKE